MNDVAVPTDELIVTVCPAFKELKALEYILELLPWIEEPTEVVLLSTYTINCLLVLPETAVTLNEITYGLLKSNSPVVVLSEEEVDTVGVLFPMVNRPPSRATAPLDTVIVPPNL